jgi:hypothetical protein
MTVTFGVRIERKTSGLNPQCWPRSAEVGVRLKLELNREAQQGRLEQETDGCLGFWVCGLIRRSGRNKVV